MSKVETTKKPMYVSVPSLASIDEYKEILESAWESGILTHNGPILQKLEQAVNQFLGVNHTVAVTNGTVALQMAIRAFNLQGEIITTPFTWIATASAIRWERCEPVFADINPQTLNIDPQKIEDAITHRTVAIMPVHVFSNPCEIEAIEDIAKRHNLKVIYDAAHAFGVNYKGSSIMNHGDISCTSWHATKLFNSGEGGACHATDKDVFDLLRRLRFFGHNDEKDIVNDGWNGKMTELHAALGLANIKYISDVMKHRKALFDTYKGGLNELDYIGFQQFDEEQYNFSYMPIIFDTEDQLLKAMKVLAHDQNYGRRYFYPSVNTMKAVGPYSAMPISESISKRIMCLPAHNRVSLERAEEIVSLIKKA